MARESGTLTSGTGSVPTADVAPGCVTAEQALSYVRRTTGGLPPEALQGHLDQCARCRRVLAEAARVVVETPPESATPFRALCDGERFLDRYQIRRFIARGGMGEVYEAFDSVLSETVALKTLLPTALDDERAAQRVLAEVRLARKVTHPNVCRILEFGTYPSRGSPRAEIPFLTMELLAGEPLARRLARTGRLPVATARKLAVDMAQGLGAIHAAGVVHRDFKSENVFLVPDGAGGERAVLTDFGLARHLNDDAPRTSNTGAAGTPDYMAPEQVEGKRPTPAFDVYALGVVIFEMLTGDRPFAAASPYLVAVKRLHEAAPAPSTLIPGLAAGWDAVVGRCLQRRPELRFPRMDDVAAALGASVLADAPARRRLARSWPVLLAVAALGGLGALAVSRRPSAMDPPSVAPVATAATSVVAPAVPAPAPGEVPSPPAPVAVAPPPAPASVSPPRKAPRPRPGKKSAAIAAAAMGPADALANAETLMLEGDVATACALGEKAAAARSAPPGVHLFLGRCYVRLGDPARARQHYRQYLELAPDAADAPFVRGILGRKP